MSKTRLNFTAFSVEELIHHLITHKGMTERSALTLAKLIYVYGRIKSRKSLGLRTLEDASAN